MEWNKINYGLEVRWEHQDSNRFWVVYQKGNKWIASLNYLYSRTPYTTKEEAIIDVERIIKIDKRAKIKEVTA